MQRRSGSCETFPHRDNASDVREPSAELTARFYCAHCGDDGSCCWNLCGSDKVSPADGHHVTLGDIHRALVKSLQEHRIDCKRPKATSGVTFEFRARVKLRRSDPVRPGRRKETVAWEGVYGRSREEYAYSDDSEDESW